VAVHLVVSVECGIILVEVLLLSAFGAETIYPAYLLFTATADVL
jgi:hypothetical protein